MSDLINEAAAAQILGISKSKLQQDRWLSRGLPYVKIGKSVRYHQSEVENYIQSNKKAPTH